MAQAVLWPLDPSLFSKFVQMARHVLSDADWSGAGSVRGQPCLKVFGNRNQPPQRSFRLFCSDVNVSAFKVDVGPCQALNLLVAKTGECANGNERDEEAGAPSSMTASCSGERIPILGGGSFALGRSSASVERSLGRYPRAFAKLNSTDIEFLILFRERGPTFKDLSHSSRSVVLTLAIDPEKVFVRFPRCRLRSSK